MAARSYDDDDIYTTIRIAPYEPIGSHISYATPRAFPGSNFRMSQAPGDPPRADFNQQHIEPPPIVLTEHEKEIEQSRWQMPQALYPKQKNRFEALTEQAQKFWAASQRHSKRCEMRRDMMAVVKYLEHMKGIGWQLDTWEDREEAMEYLAEIRYHLITMERVLDR